MIQQENQISPVDKAVVEVNTQSQQAVNTSTSDVTKTSITSIEKLDTIASVHYKNLSEKGQKILNRHDIPIDDLYDVLETIEEERGR